MRADRARPASRTLPFAGVALISLLLAGCSGSGLEGIDVSTPSYTSPGVAAADRPPVHPDVASAAVVPLTTEQEEQIGAEAAGFVPMTRPGASAAAAEVELPAASQTVAAAPVAAPAAQPTQPEATAEAASEAEAPVATAAASAPAAPGQISASGFAPAAQPTDSVKKKGFLAGFFSQKAQDAPVMSPPKVQEPKPVIKLASASPVAASLASTPVARSGPSGNPAAVGDLPGVRKTSLFEITRKDSLNDDSDVDLHEDEEVPMQMASAAGLARLAPNGLLKQRENVDVSCLKPSLVRMLKQIEGHYGRKVVVTSGYRSPEYNRRVRGARKSMHMYCAAVDVQITGVSKWELARYSRSLPGRGGVGTYCHTESVHIDIGPERDWNWRCRGRKS